MTGAGQAGVRLLGTVAWLFLCCPQGQVALAGDPETALIVDSANNLVVVQKKLPGAKKTKITFLAAGKDFTSVHKEFNTMLPHTDKNWEFAMDSNDNLLAIKKTLGSSSKTEVHRLTKASEYATTDKVWKTKLDFTDDTWTFLTDSADNLLALKTKGAKSGKVEVHKLLASEKYASSEATIVTGLPSVSTNYAFSLDLSDNLIAINRKGATHTEIHRFTKSSTYAKSNLKASLPLPKTDETWDFIVDGHNRLLAVQKGPTKSEKFEVSRIDAPSYSKVTWKRVTPLAASDSSFLSLDGTLDEGLPAAPHEGQHQHRAAMSMMRAERLVLDEPEKKD